MRTHRLPICLHTTAPTLAKAGFLRGMAWPLDVNKKGFKPANKPDFISKVQALVEKYNAGLKAYEAEMAEAKAINQSLNYTVFSNRTSDIEIDVVMEATTVSDALAAFADME